MPNMGDRELLNAIFYELKAVRAKVDKTADEFVNFRCEINKFKEEMYVFRDDMYEFKEDMLLFRKETANNFNKVNRQLRFVEADYDQLNRRVDALEVSSNS